MKRLFATLIFGMQLFGATAWAAIVAGPVVNPTNGHSYYVISPNTWTAAQQEARSMRGNLATINDADELAWVMGQFNTQADPRNLWIGFRDELGNGNYAWVDGTPVGFTKWYPGEPNQLSAERHTYIFRVNSRPDGQWNNAANYPTENGAFGGGAPIYGLVEVPSDPRVLAGPIVNPANGHAYYLLGKDTWENSKLRAETLGGHLVTINDAEEQAWVVSTFNNTNAPRNLWIGLKDMTGTGTYTWDDGTPVSYTNWYPGEPNNVAQERYAFIWTVNRVLSATWNNIADRSTVDGLPTDPLHAVVEVEVPILSAEVSAVRLCWNSSTNTSYQIQYRSGLTTNTWVNTGTPVAGNGAIICVEEPVVSYSEGRFYRVQEVQ